MHAIETHALRLLGGWLGRAARDGWLRFEPCDGGALWPEEIGRLIERRSRELAGAPLVGADEATWTPEASGEGLRADLERALGEGRDPAAERWHELTRRLTLDPVEVQALALLVAIDVDQALARAWRWAWANVMQASMSWGFLVKVLAGAGGMGEVAARLAPGRSGLLRVGLVEVDSPQAPTPLSERGLVLAPEVTPALLGWNEAPEGLRSFESIAAPPARLARALRPKLREVAQGAGPLRALIHGPRGSGRLAVAAQLAQGAGAREGLWTLDLGQAVAQGRGDQAIAEATRLSALYDVVVIGCGLERLGEQARRWIEATEAAFTRAAAPLIWVVEGIPDEHFTGAGSTLDPRAVIGVGYPSAALRTEVWREALADVEAAPRAIEQLANQHLLSEGQIARVVQVARAVAQPATPGLDTLADAARAAARLGLGQLASPEPARVLLDQLIVSDETRTAIEELISYVRHREALRERWGFAAQHSHGLGVTCLFCGPPGTGKTFGAQAVATALSLELYRVDLSQLVSKYIGETEKHLATLFDAAEQGQVLLLFDEADSLFGKRTDVKTSVDRYANLEVNYLLQRIERFDGVTILTTNFEKGIDEAFARRIRYRLAFDAPDPEARARLWRAMLPSQVPVASDVDLDALAEHYELSGGHIKEVVLRAASLAFDQPTQTLTQALLLRSANVEYRKLGKLPVSLPRTPRSRSRS